MSKQLNRSNKTLPVFSEIMQERDRHSTQLFEQSTDSKTLQVNCIYNIVIIMSYHQIEYVYPLLVNIIEQVRFIFLFSIVRSLRPKVFQSDSVRCFSQRQCPESEITWCFNLYHPSKCIEVCWDSSGNVINMTENGLPLELDSVFSVTNVSSLTIILKASN